MEVKSESSDFIVAAVVVFKFKVQTHQEHILVPWLNFDWILNIYLNMSYK